MTTIKGDGRPSLSHRQQPWKSHSQSHVLTYNDEHLLIVAFHANRNCLLMFINIQYLCRKIKYENEPRKITGHCFARFRYAKCNQFEQL